VLTEAGFEQQQPGAEGIARRFIRDEAVIDVLAPDNVGGRANLKLGFGRTIAVPGATQALTRVGLVGVSIGDRSSAGPIRSERWWRRHRPRSRSRH